MNFFPQRAELPESPPIEIPAVELASPEKILAGSSSSSVKTDFDEEPIRYEPPPTPEPQSTPETPSTPEPVRQAEHSSAYPPEVQRGIPREILEDRLPVEQADEYYRRLELNTRVREFQASLPDDMPATEKREAVREFRLRAKDSLGLQ